MNARNKYENAILSRFDDLLNIFLPVALLGAIVIMVLFHIVMPDIVLSAYFVVAIITLSILIIFRAKITSLTKIYAMIFLTLLGASLIILRVRLDAAGLIVYLMGAIIVFGMLPKKDSMYFSVLSTLMLLSTAYLTSKEHTMKLELTIKNPSFQHFIFWGIIIVLYLVFCVLLYVIIHSIKDDLLDSLMTTESANARIEKLAYFDSLTELPNIHLLRKQYQKSELRSGYLAIINIRGLNLINSVYGGSMRDKVMQKTAHYLKLMAMPKDLIGRISGNDFFWCIKSKSREEMIQHIEDFVTLAHRGSDDYGVHFNVLYKVGIVNTDESLLDIDDWIRKAYSALEKSKTANKKIISWYDQDIEDALKEEEELMELLSDAVEGDEFQMYYQEKMDCRSRKAVGVEALVRWHSDKLGLVSPAAFIPLIDKLQLSVIFGESIIRLVAQDYPKLKKKYDDDFTVSINISPHHLLYEGFIDFLTAEIIGRGIDPMAIVFEITEDNLIKDLDSVQPLLLQLHAIGFKLSIDDFGTGYSSLSYLSKLNFEELKIDQSFILNMMQDQRTKKLVQAIISLKKIYGFNIIAEGVETQELSDALKDMECYIHQGLLYSKPTPVE